MAGERRRYVVGAWKIPFEERDLAHEVITDEDDRGYFNIIRGNDGDPADIGRRATYRVELTDEEAARFRAASNARYVELDRIDSPDNYDDFPIPQPDVMAYMGAADHQATWHGRDVLVAIADDGTTAAARDYMGLTLVDRENFANTDPGSGTNGDHGCKVLADLVPANGQVLDAIVADPVGANRSNAVAGWAWAADQGAQVINFSYSGDPGSETSVYEDGVRYLHELGVALFCSTGNDGVLGMGTPANYSRIYPNVVSVGSFNHDTDERATSSNHHTRMSGVAPGDFPVWGLTTGGEPVEWSGTSAASPHAAQLCVMGLTGGHFTPMQVVTALKRYTRDTGEPDSDQGGGAFDFDLAITELTKTAAVADDAVTARSWTVASGPAQVGATLSTSTDLSWTPTTAGVYVLRYSATSDAGTTTDDVTVTVTESDPLPANPGEALWIGPTSGKNHFNIGIGVETAQGGGGDDDHVDTDQDDIENGFSQDPNFKLTDDASAVHFQIGVDAGRTSENTSYPRSELRELDESGENAAWDGGSGTHYMRGRSRITHTAAEKPWVVFFQIHDAESDLIRVQTESGGSGPTGLRIRARRTPPGGGSEVTTTLLSSYTLGDWIDWEIRVVNGLLTVTLNDVQVLSVAGGGDSEGCYFKAGAYAQSNTSTEGGDDTQFFSVEIEAGSFQAWHTGYATPTTPVYTGAPSDLLTHTLYLTNTAPSHVPTVTQGFWSENDPAVTTPLLLGSSPSGTATTTALAETSTTNPYYGLIRQFVSHPVSVGGTLTGVYQVVAGVQESDAAADMVFTVSVWVTQGEAAAARGTALAHFGAEEWPTTAAGRVIGQPSAVTNDVEFQAGDRFVLEIGYRATNAVATSYTGTLNHGGTASPDLAVDGTDFTHPGWITLQVSGAPGLEFVDPGNNADAGLATGQGEALSPTLQTDNSPDAGLASGTGSALDPTVTLEARPAAGLASGTGQAQTPGVSSDGNVSVAVPAATGVGAALDPAPSGAITPAAGLATGTGEAFGVLRGVNADAGLASGTGVAQEVDPQPNAQPSAGLASGTGQAHTPTVSDEDPIGTPILRNQFTDLDHHLVIEVAWGADLIGDGSEWEWTDITQDVRQHGAVEISMGRSDEASTTQPAELKLALDNRQGLYSAGGQSPNWPYVRRNTPVRVRVDPGTEQETYVTRFFGYATSWTPVWDDSGKNAEVQLSAHGVLRRLGQRAAPTLSSIRRAILDRPDIVAYWPCEEGKGALKIASAFPGHPAMTIAGALEQPFPKFAENDDFDCSRPLPELAQTTWQGAVPAYDVPSPAAIEVRWLMVTPELLNGTEATIMTVYTTGTITKWDVNYVNALEGSLRVIATNTDGVSTEVTFTNFAVNNTIRQYGLRMEQDGNNIAVGVTNLAAGWAVGTFIAPTVTDESIIACSAVSVAPNRDIDDTIIGHIQVRNTALTSYTELTELAANAGEIASDRIERLCAENNIPVTIIGTSDVKMGPQLVDDVLALLRECEAADQGVLVDGLHAGLTYICRSEREGRTADLTLDASQGHPAGGIEPVDDDQRNLNKATATRTRGLEATFEDVDGPMGTKAVGEYDDSVEVNTHEDLDIGDYASWLVNQGTVEGYRYPTLKVDLSAKPALLDAWLQVLPSSRVDVTNLSDVREQLPVGDVQLLVEGYSEEINQMTWTAEMQCSSYEPWRLGVLASSSADTDAYVLRAVSDGSTLNASAAEGESTLAVSTPTGPRWTTALGNFPLDISVGGIRVTVTGISGSGTTQTFTVDPDTVVKDLPAGLTVDVWRPTLSAR